MFRFHTIFIKTSQSNDKYYSPYPPEQCAAKYRNDFGRHERVRDSRKISIMKAGNYEGAAEELLEKNKGKRE